MNAFLNKHNIDVGRTFSILLFAGMVDEIYSSLGALLGGPGIALNFGIVIMYFLGVGMWRHQESSRRWCIVLLYAAAVLLIGLVIATAFTSGIALKINGYVEKDPPLWKGVALIVAVSPVFYVLLSALHSEKAKIEFTGLQNYDAEQFGRGDGDKPPN